MNKNELIWLEKYNLAKEFFMSNGHLSVPRNFETKEGFKLGYWIHTQRKNYKIGKLSQKRIDLLNSIDMIWDASLTNGCSFPEYFIYYIFKEYYGEEMVLYRNKSLGFELDVYIPHFNLAIEYDGIAWHNNKKDISKDKKAFTKGINMYRFREPGLDELQTSNCFCLENPSSNILKLTKEIYDYISNTFSINIKYSIEKVYNEYSLLTLNRLKKEWFENFNLAKEYFMKNGHLSVPRKYKTKEGIKLGIWISTQRECYKEGKLSQERIDLLNSIGMIWDVSSDFWFENFNLAKEFFVENGHLLISQRFETKKGIKLGAWISNQRTHYKEGKLSQERINLLESIGMVWDVRQQKKRAA